MFPPPLLFCLNHLLSQASWARARLRPFAGRRLTLDAGEGKTAAFVVSFVVTAEGLFAPGDGDSGNDESNTVITLQASLPGALADRETLFKSAHLSGNAEFAEAISFVFRHLQWDAEADIARFTGDLLAPRLAAAGASLVRHALPLLQDVYSDLLPRAREKCREVLRARTGVAITPELSAFATEVGALETQTAALEQRLDLLQPQ